MRTPQVGVTRLEVLQYLKDYQRRYGKTPTQETVAEGLGITNQTVSHHIAALAAEGLVLKTGRVPSLNTP